MNQPKPAVTPSSSEPPFVVPAKWSWHLRTLLRLRDRLGQQTREHLAEAETLQRTDSDFGSRAAEESEFENLLAEVRSEGTLLAEVEAALQRLRHGTYGVCVVTQHSIPMERLRALPWTRFNRGAAATGNPKTLS